MKITGRNGVVRIRLDRIEKDLLTNMFADFAELVETDEFEHGDPVRSRLYPAGYREDDAAAQDFRGLTEESLRIERAQRARASAAQVSARGDVVLDAETAQPWIQSLNDLRLALGTRLDVSEDDQIGDMTPGAPLAQEWAVYHWLTGLQDAIVRRLML